MFSLGLYWSLSAFNFPKAVGLAGTPADERTTQSDCTGYPDDTTACWVGEATDRKQEYKTFEFVLSQLEPHLIEIR
jgi:hypothetical protein